MVEAGGEVATATTADTVATPPPPQKEDAGFRPVTLGSGTVIRVPISAEGRSEKASDPDITAATPPPPGVCVRGVCMCVEMHTCV